MLAELGSAFFRSAAVAVAAGLALGCAQPGPTSPRERESAAPARPADSVLQIGMLLESQPVGAMTTYGRGTGLGGREHFFAFHASLTMFDPNSEQVPII